MAQIAAVRSGVFASTGNVLSVAHVAGMQASFPLLQKNYKFGAVRFWGRLQGKAGDYLIAVGIEDSWVAGKKFFYWCARAAPPRRPTRTCRRGSAIARSERAEQAAKGRRSR